MEADFTIPMLGLWVAGMVTLLEVADTLVPTGGVPVAVPVLEREPLSTSVWEVVEVAVQVWEAPTASVAMVSVPLPQLMAESPTIGSVTATEVRATLPVLVTA